MLLKELLIESEIQVISGEELWSQGSSDAKEYRSASQYLVRQMKGSTGKYEAFKVVGDQKKQFGVFTATELRAALVPLRSNQKPDVEGFTVYVDPEKVEAFQYKGEPMKVDLDDDGDSQKISSGDYLVRTPDGSKFTFSIEKEADFESTLTEV